MLVLTRRIGERLVIDGAITLEVVEISGQRVRLGITAPDDVTILRQELLAPDLTPAALASLSPGAP